MISATNNATLGCVFSNPVCCPESSTLKHFQLNEYRTGEGDSQRKRGFVFASSYSILSHAGIVGQFPGLLIF